jgi:hypothetical protein
MARQRVTGTRVLWCPVCDAWRTCNAWRAAVVSGVWYMLHRRCMWCLVYGVRAYAGLAQVRQSVTERHAQLEAERRERASAHLLRKREAESVRP